MRDFFTNYRTEIIRSVMMAVALLVLGGVFVYPLYAELGELSADIEQTRLALERQRVFLPEYRELERRAGEGAEAAFPVPDPMSVPLADISELPGLVSACAESEGMGVLDVVLSPASLKRGNGQLKLQAVLEGSVGQFRGCYLKLAALGEVARFSRVEMQAVPGGVEFFVELWVHMKERTG